MPAGSTYTPIATTTLGSAQSTVTFNSFSGYTDLVLVFNGSASTGNPVAWLRFNSDSGSNYSGTNLGGSGSAASSGRDTNVVQMYLSGVDTLSTGMSQLIINVQNYSNTTTNKTVLTRSGNAANGTSAVVGLWRSTSAITSITLGLTSGNYATGSTFTLYGIASA